MADKPNLLRRFIRLWTGGKDLSQLGPIAQGIVLSLMAFVLGYAILPFSLIPNYIVLFGGLQFIDDIFVLVSAILVSNRLVGEAKRVRRPSK